MSTAEGPSQAPVLLLAAGLVGCAKAPVTRVDPEPTCEVAGTAAWVGLETEAGRAVEFWEDTVVLGAPMAGDHGGVWTAQPSTAAPAVLLLAPAGVRMGSTVIVHGESLLAVGEAPEGGAAVWAPHAQTLGHVGSGSGKGATAASAGDTLWVGLPWAGAGEIWSVKDGDSQMAWKGEGRRSFAGAFLSDAGDTNGDGVPEILVGAFGASSSAGRAYLVSSEQSGDLADAEAQVHGAAAFHLLGFSGAAGDLDGDGYSDVALGVPGLDATGPSSGGVAVYFGPLAGDLGLHDARAGLVGGGSHQGAGWAVAVRAGPQPGLAVGGRLYDNGRGAAWVVDAPSQGTIMLETPDIVGAVRSEAGASVATSDGACEPVLVGGPGTGSAWLLAAP